MTEIVNRNTLVRKRATIKTKITSCLNEAKGALSENTLTENLFSRIENSIKELLKKIALFDDELDDAFINAGVPETDDAYISEINSQSSYLASVTRELSNVANELKEKVTVNVENRTNASTSEGGVDSLSENGTATSQPGPMGFISTMKLRPPELKCSTFAGGDRDKFHYKNFVAQFKNCIEGFNLSPMNKLLYLRSYLQGYALNIISHLSITDSNYVLAWELLDKEFLDTNEIIHDLFKIILDKKPKFMNAYEGVKIYLNEMRSLIFELKNYEINFLEENSSGALFVSHIIYNNLPNTFKRELVHKIDSNYPTLSQIFENYSQIIKTINNTSRNFDSKHVKYSQREQSSNHKPKTPALENFQVASQSKETENVVMYANKDSKTKACKFCNLSGHTMNKCTRYKTVKERCNRLEELNLCNKCSSDKHKTNACPGNENKLFFECFYCKTKQHISAVCPKVQNTKLTSTNIYVNESFRNNQPFLLPIMEIKIFNGKKFRKLVCLVDTGSQRSYFSKSSVDFVVGHRKYLNSVDYEVRTFLGSKSKNLVEFCLDVVMPSGQRMLLPALLDDNFNIEFKVPCLDLAVKNIHKAGFNLNDNSLVNSGKESVKLDGLLGVDFIQFFGKIKMIKCLNGTAFETDKGIIPFGNIDQFLKPNQIRPASYIATKNNELNFSQMVKKHGKHSTHVNFVLDPKDSYPDPLKNIIEESSVERGLENLFNLESLGINANNEENSYDNNMIEKFKESIVHKENKYFVKLPWNKDILDKVPSNHETALAVLNKVVENLEKKNLLSEYKKVFREQEAENIIERVNIKPSNFHKYVWIPHRPVIKDEDQTTTKVRPVFNCSLKTNKQPSLNEAAYAGVNLVNDLMKLLLYFRSNKHVLIADIRKAFLMIRLISEEDQNKFCFFMIENDKLITYRYKTLLFGFNASPFILNYVLKHHAAKFEKDYCSHLLQNNFYVDNFVVSSNSVNELAEIYQTSCNRMQEGGFELRSWNSNSIELQNMFKKDNTFVEHGCDLEKILGYKYSTSNDTLQISECTFNDDVSSKRKLLSATSKIFDPLGLCSPISVRGKILMRKLWSLKLKWDEPVEPDIRKEWESLRKDLIEVPKLGFPRFCLNSDANAELVFFCDASKLAYGFSCYCLSNNESQLAFSKVRVAPMKQKTLPTLELLSVYLAFKCMPNIVGAYHNAKFTKITVAVDAQVVLSWLLTNMPKSKNVFANNRVKDISVMKQEYTDEFGIELNYKYVKTAENPADLLTRGINYKEFAEKFQFWTKGPDWLIGHNWPESELNCLNDKNKNIIQTQLCANISSEENKEIFSPLKYSSLNKLLNVTSNVFKFILRTTGKTDINPYKKGLDYWLKNMQSFCFNKEIIYLKNPNNKNVPVLVKDLNLFLDEKGLIRSKGRISKNLDFDYEVINPILLARDNHITSLIINDCHQKVKHLGISATINKVRMSGFWVPKARSQIKKVISPCIVCKKVNSLSFKYPKMTDLPKHRVNLIKPFRHVGVDFTSHLFVKNEGEKDSKYYILLFTCLNVRAVHIELVPDMSAKSFVLAFVRFTNIYGIPSHIYSDNARSFIAGCNIIEKAFISDEFLEKFKIYQIKHIRIPLYSAWVGSVWERLIKVVKSCLFKTIGRSRIKYFELLTILSDIQTAINGRPLTYRCAEDSLEGITPNCFINANSRNERVVIKSEDKNVWDKDIPSRKDLINSLSIRDKMSGHFRELWTEEYLLALREQFKDLHEVNWHNKIKINDVVLIQLPNKSRPFWLLGRVVELIAGYDNKIRSAKIKRADGQVQIHSLKHLYPLELSTTHDFKAVQVDKSIKGKVFRCKNDRAENINKKPTKLATSGRPVREAARKCNAQLKLYKKHFY